MNDEKILQDVTKRFLLICDEVIKEGLADNKSDFAESVGEHLQNMSQMRRGGRVPTIKQLAAACQKYGYSANWLLLNSGDKKMKMVPQKTIEQRVSDLELAVANLRRSRKNKE